MSQPEFTEDSRNLAAAAHELAEAAMGLPLGWKIVINEWGQLVITPPSARAEFDDPFGSVDDPA